MGLLSKASSLDFSTKLAFTDFIKTHKIKACAVYEIKNDYFYISNSIGFDSFSILASKSTKDFWTGICPEINKKYFFQKESENYSSLLQFFSFTMQETLESIVVYRTEDKLFVLLNQELYQEIITDFTQIDFSYVPVFNISELNLNSLTAYKYEISINQAVDSYEEEFQPSLINEISNRILCNYSANTAVIVSSNKIHLFYLTEEDFDDRTFPQHLKLNLSEAIDNNSNKISVIFNGSTSDINEIELFMKAE